MNLHLIHNDKFFLPAFLAFEKNYPNKNLYLCLTSVNDKKIYTQHKNVLYVSLLTLRGITKVKKFIKNHAVSNFLVHNADINKINFALDFKKNNNVEIYWIFFGADLYSRLVEDKKYNAFDHLEIQKPNQKNTIHKLKLCYQNLSYFYMFGKFPNSKFETFCEQVDYFCFWNENDYELLIHNYKTKAVFKNFLYFDLLPSKQNLYTSKLKNKILVNHNASAWGNHKTILKKLNEIGSDDDILCPLSYGDDKIKYEIEKYAYNLFGSKIFIIMEFMSKDDYFQILSEVKVAIFGHRRQEAGANIFAMLLFGAKVFLRNDNNMLKWLKERGFICFSFENDLNSVEDLDPLDNESIVLNQDLYDKYFSKEVETNIFKNLIKNV